MGVRPKHVTDNLNKIVNNYWNIVALDGNLWIWCRIYICNEEKVSEQQPKLYVDEKLYWKVRYTHLQDDVAVSYNETRIYEASYSNLLLAPSWIKIFSQGILLSDITSYTSSRYGRPSITHTSTTRSKIALVYRPSFILRQTHFHICMARRHSVSVHKMKDFAPNLNNCFHNVTWSKLHHALHLHLAKLNQQNLSRC
jgi:hypothetical protein